jgi:hypothetical protein
MKKSFSFFKGAAFSKLGFLPFLMTFLFLAGMQVDMKAQQQQTNAIPTNQNMNPVREMSILPKGPFVTVPVAQDRLLTAMKALKDQLAQNAEGTAPYDAAFLRFTYYSYISINLEAGKAVDVSILEATGMLTSNLALPVTPQQAVTERNAAINLLKL